MTDLQKKAEEIYRRMTSYANYSEMNGISKKWILGQIEVGLEEYADEQSVQFAEWLKENAPMGLYNNGKCIKPYTTYQLLTIFKEQNETIH